MKEVSHKVYMMCDSNCMIPEQGNLEQRRTDHGGFGEQCVGWRVLCVASMGMSVIDCGGSYTCLPMCFSINFDFHFKYVNSISVKTNVFNVHTKTLHEENEMAAST